MGEWIHQLLLPISCYEWIVGHTGFLTLATQPAKEKENPEL